MRKYYFFGTLEISKARLVIIIEIETAKSKLSVYFYKCGNKLISNLKETKKKIN